jgi:hypothetical protein
MALKKTISTVYGFNVADAYHRIENVTLNGKDKLNFNVRIYTVADKPFFAENVMSCDYDLNGANPIAQAYEYLKTLPEFAGAVDC